MSAVTPTSEDIQPAQSAKSSSMATTWPSALEVTSLIFRQLSRKSLENVRLVSRTFNTLAEPILFATLHIKVLPTSLDTHARLVQNPRLANYVKVVEYGQSWKMSTSDHENIRHRYSVKIAHANYNMSSAESEKVHGHLASTLSTQDSITSEYEFQQLTNIVKLLPQVKGIRCPSSSYLKQLASFDENPHLSAILALKSLTTLSAHIFWTLGGQVVIENLDDQHFQRLLRAFWATNRAIQLTSIEGPSFYGIRASISSSSNDVPHFEDLRVNLPILEQLSYQFYAINMDCPQMTHLSREILASSPIASLEIQNFYNDFGARTKSLIAPILADANLNLAELRSLRLVSIRLSQVHLQNLLLDHSKNLKSLFLKGITFTLPENQRIDVMGFPHFMRLLNQSMQLDSLMLRGDFTSEGRRARFDQRRRPFVRVRIHDRVHDRGKETDCLSHLQNFGCRKAPFPAELYQTFLDVCRINGQLDHLPYRKQEHFEWTSTDRSVAVSSVQY